MSWRLCHFWITSLHVPLALALRSSYGEVQSCAYTELYDAQVERTFWGNVQVKYCGTSITLTQSSAQPSAWTIVNWWDPKLQNTSLTDDDLKTFKEHLGSYEHSMAVGMLGRGLVPAQPENGEWAWKQSDPVALVREVLNFEVKLARGLNKLPDSTNQTYFWRGAWLPPEALDSLRAGSTVSFPWFQSATTDEVHSYTFIHTKWQPTFCAPSCERRGYAFPVHFHIESCHAKDMRKWNADESEFILLPNLRFEVVNVTKIANDPVWEATAKEMEAWLRRKHELPEWYMKQDIFRSNKDPKVVGPWPKVADVVRDWHMNGPVFLAWYNVRFTNPNNGLDKEMNMSFEETYDLRKAMDGRFRLATLGGYRKTPNSARFFHRVELRDALPCQ